MIRKNFDNMLELEDITHQFETIERLIHIIKENHYNKNDVYYTKLKLIIKLKING